MSDPVCDTQLRTTTATATAASTANDGRPALIQLLTDAKALELDQVTRLFLVITWACEEAARAGTLEAASLDHICTLADTPFPSEILTVLNAARPWDITALCAIMAAHCPAAQTSPFTTQGALVTLEGGDGSGKTSQVQAVATLLRQQGHSVVTTRALGGAPGAGSLALRAFILNPDFVWDSIAEGFLTASIFREGLAKVIVPALQQDQIVICDRLLDTLQIYVCDEAAGLTAPIYETLFDLMVADIAPQLRPHLTFLLDISYEEGLRRRTARDGSRPDRNEAKSPDFHRGVFARYRQLAARTPRITTIDAAKPFDTVTQTIATHTHTWITQHA